MKKLSIMFNVKFLVGLLVSFICLLNFNNVAISSETNETEKINLDNLKFNVIDKQDELNSTDELGLIAPNELLATVGSYEIYGKDFNERLDSEIPPYVPRNVIKKADKEKFLEQMVNDKMIELELTEKKFESSEIFIKIMNDMKKRVILHFYMTDLVRSYQPNINENEVKEYYEKYKSTIFKDKDFESVKQVIKDELKNMQVENYLTKFWTDLVKEYDVKTNENVLIKVKDIDNLSTDELNLAIFETKAGNITLSDIKDICMIDKIVSNNQADYDLTNDEQRKLIIDNVLKTFILSNAAMKKGYDPEKNEKIKTELELIKNTYLRRYFVNIELFNNINVSNDEIKKYYEENKQNLANDKVHASHILVDTEEKAKEIEKRLKAGENFEEIAKKESICPSKEKGGDLGEFGRNVMVKEFEDVAFNTKKGEISPIVKTRFGFHIIKVTDVIKGEIPDLTSEVSLIKQTLMRQKKIDAFNNYKKYLVDKYKPKMYFEKIK